MDLHHVAVLALDRVIPLDLAIPVEVFTALADMPYHVQVCAPTATVRTTAGFSITPQAGLDALAFADTVVVPGFEPHNKTLAPEVLTSLRRAHTRGARMISICVGAFALAGAGILDRRPATSHWQNVAELAQRFPTIDVKPDVLYIDDGDVLTSAGVSSGLDLCLHVARKDLGVTIARRVAQVLVTAPHRDGNQAQFVARPLDVDDAGSFAGLCTWIKQNLQADISLDRLADRSALTPRTFTRRFRQSTGVSPLQWVLTARIDEARRLLETTGLSIEEVTRRCGLGTALNLRTHFRQRLDTTPTAYRRGFRSNPYYTDR